MRFLRSDDQEALREGMASLCAGRFSMERVRAGFDAEGWKELASAGVFTLAEIGGLADAAVVFEELGRSLVPGPLVWGYLAGRDDVVSSGVMNGVVTYPDDVAMVHAFVGDRVHAVPADAVEWSAVSNPVDPLTPMGKVTTVGDGDDVGPVSDWQRRGAVLSAAQLVGIAAATAEMAVAYAKERQQFDKPIGAFQAVKHLCADMRVRADLARAAVDAAAVTYDDPGVGDVDRAVAAAKVVAGDAAIANAKACLQVHGGMGFTWEVDVHLHLKRAWMLDRQFGTSDSHAQQLGSR